MVVWERMSGAPRSGVESDPRLSLQCPSHDGDGRNIRATADRGRARSAPFAGWVPGTRIPSHVDDSTSAQRRPESGIWWAERFPDSEGGTPLGIFTIPARWTWVFGCAGYCGAPPG